MASYESFCFILLGYLLKQFLLKNSIIIFLYFMCDLKLKIYKYVKIMLKINFKILKIKKIELKFEEQFIINIISFISYT
jgi:hypothetical protein